MKRRRIIKYSALCGVFLLIAALAASLLLSAFCLKTTSYTVALPQMQGELRMVCLADLHGLQFGKDNARLVENIRTQKPQLIAMMGDMLPKAASQADVTSFCDLIGRLKEIAPVYLSVGNTEKKYMEQQDSGLLQQLTKAGAVVLNERWEEIRCGDEVIRLGGMYEYAFIHNQMQDEWESSSTYRFLHEFERTDLPTVLLCHRPDSFIFYQAYRDWDIDLLLCGHTHGGIIRVPFYGGLKVANQDWFPTYDYGRYALGTTTMLITSGFAGYDNIPRFNNRPEIVSVTLTGNE